MSFSRQVERWRPTVQAMKLAAMAPEEPTSVALAWIQVESNGDNTGGYKSGVSPIGERGMGQIHPDEAKERLGLSPEEFKRVSSDPAYSILQTIRLAKSYSGTIYALFRTLGINWPINSWDYWAAVKLYHALPTVAKELFTKVTEKFGAPHDWSDFYQKSIELISSGSVGPLAIKLGARVLSTTDKMLALAEQDDSSEPSMVRL